MVPGQRYKKKRDSSNSVFTNTFGTGKITLCFGIYRHRLQGPRKVPVGEGSSGRPHRRPEGRTSRRQAGKRLQAPRSGALQSTRQVSGPRRQEDLRSEPRQLAETTRWQEVGQGRQDGQTLGRVGRAQRIITPLQVRASEFVVKQSDEFPLGGRLRHFIGFWRQITRDPTVLKAVLGVSIPFTHTPTNAHANRPYHFDESTMATLRGFVHEMLENQVIVPVQRQSDQVVYPFFLVVNKDKSLRGILNVKKMNEDCLQTRKFKMETLMRVLPLIRRGDWFGSWDLRKGYYNVAVHPDFQKFFCFEFENRRYMFKCLVMGISIAPFIFTKLMATLVQFARAAGIDVSFYLDDTLLRGPTYNVAWRDLRAFGELLQLAGFLLHRDKSVSEPTQIIMYLGFIICSRTMTIQLPPEKETKIRTALQKALRDANTKTPWSIRDAAQLIGWLLAAIPAVQYGQGHFQSLEHVKKHALAAANNDYDQQSVVWHEPQVEDMQWWLNQPNPMKRRFEKRPFTAEFTSKNIE